MNEQTATEWRDCADPDELAAAVAAGVEVRAMGRAGDFPTANQTADQFAGSLRAGITYQLPASWSWRPEPPAPDEVRERLRLGIEDAVNDYADVVMDIMDAEVVRHAGWLAARLEEADAERTTLRHRLVETMPTPPPVPPWPGAVLSGLCDEDGEPTWLAQAGQVRGEQVRGWRDMAWYRPDGHSSDTWVEVRAPRAVPEPETERVPWVEVLKDDYDVTCEDGGTFIPVAVVWDPHVPGLVVTRDIRESWKQRGQHQPVAPDGTVEVLKVAP